MRLEVFLLEKKAAITKKWNDLVLGSYPSDAQRFLKKEKNRFSNPVGQNTAEGLNSLYDELIAGGDPAKIASCLDQIIRIRAIQDFKPSQAVGFLLPLKKLIRDEIAKHGNSGELLKEMGQIEVRIESAAMQAFDIYSECREKLFNLRVNETRNQVARLLERANLTIQIPEIDGEP